MLGTNDGEIGRPVMVTKTENKCKECNCNCHCKQEVHADVYGVCTCDNCKCNNPTNDGEECLSCQ